MRVFVEEANGLNSVGSGGHRYLDVTDSPMPTVQAQRPVNLKIEDDGKPMMKPDENKPTYRVPSMGEINVIPWNGFRVVSTFSGAGGSCLGYRMAGFKVIWANEFVPAAQESYRANKAADCFLDGRDIRTIKPEEILSATGLQQGELDLFDGSPPCQAFSTAGKREKGWGKGKKYEHGVVQKNEELFSEYIRILRGLRPKTFVAENVSGLVKGTAKGYFLEILAELKASGYRVKCKILDAQWLGVPQMRQRTIFVGVREDLGLDPVHPKPLPYRYSVREAIPWIARAQHDTSGIMSCGPIADRPSPAVMANRAGTHFVEAETDISRYAIGQELLPPSRQGTNAFNTTLIDPDKPSGTVTIASPGNDLAVPIPGRTERRKFTIAELKRICAFPDDFVLVGSYTQQWERLGNSVPPVMMYHIAKKIRDEVLLRLTT